mmetsp:Transcript_16212/g.49283  ORF Transcript_16212/g.49283 Transcript_16212/m.49283 type:complete len:176 (+) Transcript_16212:307-834(+)
MTLAIQPDSVQGGNAEKTKYKHTNESMAMDDGRFLVQRLAETSAAHWLHANGAADRKGSCYGHTTRKKVVARNLSGTHAGRDTAARVEDCQGHPTGRTNGRCGALRVHCSSEVDNHVWSLEQADANHGSRTCESQRDGTTERSQDAHFSKDEGAPTLIELAGLGGAKWHQPGSRG